MKLQANLLLLLTSVIWGFGFVAQDEAMKYLDPYSFNFLRFLLGALSLFPLVYFLGRKNTGLPKAGKAFWVIGVLAGLALLGGATLQQLGIDHLGDNESEATAGKAGFITGLCLVIVPLLFAILNGGLLRKAKDDWPDAYKVAQAPVAQVPVAQVPVGTVAQPVVAK